MLFELSNNCGLADIQMPGQLPCGMKFFYGVFDNFFFKGIRYILKASDFFIGIFSPGDLVNHLFPNAIDHYTVNIFGFAHDPPFFNDIFKFPDIAGKGIGLHHGNGQRIDFFIRVEFGVVCFQKLIG